MRFLKKYFRSPQVLGHLDIPSTFFVTCSGKIHLIGWTLLRNGQPVRYVEVFYNNIPLGQCRYGIQRLDVFQVYPERLEAKQSGFSGHFAVPNNFFGWLEVFVTDSAGHRWRFNRLCLLRPNDFFSLKDPRKNQKAFGVNISGFLTAESGLGQLVRGYVVSLRQLQIPLSLFDFASATPSRKEDKTLKGFQKKNPYSVNLLCMNPDVLPIFVYQAQPHYFKRRFNIGVWAWELPRLPKHWHFAFSYFDEIWTLSRFTAESLRRDSPVPVYVIPPVVNPHLSRKYTKKDFGIPEDHFTFLFAFDFYSQFERKNPLGIVEAFQKEFHEAEPVCLVLKCINGTRHLKNLEKLKRIEGPQIRVIDHYLSRGETHGLISVSDAYVSLHRSEGFGFTMAEAMYFCKPVIATAWSGNMDFMTPENSYLVPYTLRPIEEDHGPYQEGNVWAQPDTGAAARFMREVYENPRVADKKAHCGAENIKSGYSVEAIAAKLKERLESIYKNDPCQ